MFYYFLLGRRDTIPCYKEERRMSFLDSAEFPLGKYKFSGKTVNTYVFFLFQYLGELHPQFDIKYRKVQGKNIYEVPKKIVYFIAGNEGKCECSYGVFPQHRRRGFFFALEAPASKRGSVL